MQMQFVSDCLSGAGVVLLWGVATIVAAVLFQAGCNAVGWLTQRVFHVTEPDRYVWRGRISLSDRELR
jgi:hypothetical protein